METIYNRIKRPSLFKRGSLNRFGIIMLINIYRVCIYKISFPDSSLCSSMLRAIFCNVDNES